MRTRARCGCGLLTLAMLAENNAARQRRALVKRTRLHKTAAIGHPDSDGNNSGNKSGREVNGDVPYLMIMKLGYVPFVPPFISHYADARARCGSGVLMQCA